jgi:hypothetical protein
MRWLAPIVFWRVAETIAAPSRRRTVDLRQRWISRSNVRTCRRVRGSRGRSKQRVNPPSLRTAAPTDPRGCSSAPA